MQQTKLMVLGASAAQLPMIHKAVALGCHVITVDNVPGNIGHQFSHQAIHCSTIDRTGVLKMAQTLNINGIVTFASDVATATVAYVAEQLGLIACPLQVAETMSNKANFRRFQRKHQLTHPDFVIIEPLEAFDSSRLNLTPPLIFKPVDTSGSRGISKVDNLDTTLYQHAFNAARNFARSGVVSIEKFMTGIDVSGDGFLLNGQLCGIVTQKYKQGFIPAGHSFPTQLSSADQARIFEAVAKTCQALDYRDGPVDFDVNISAEQVVIIEMSPRLGGNGIPELIRRSTGVDLMDLTIRYALGRLDRIPEAMTVNRRSGSWIFGIESGGQLEQLATKEAIFAEVPALFELVFNYQIGETVPPFEHSGNCLGFALFDCPPDRQYEDMVANLQTALQLRVKTN